MFALFLKGHILLCKRQNSIVNSWNIATTTKKQEEQVFFSLENGVCFLLNFMFRFLDLNFKLSNKKKGIRIRKLVINLLGSLAS